MIAPRLIIAPQLVIAAKLMIAPQLMVNPIITAIFLDASTHLYMRVSPFVGPSVGPSVRRLVDPPFFMRKSDENG